MIRGSHEPYSIFRRIVGRSLRADCNVHKGMYNLHLDIRSNLRKCECELAKLAIAARDVDADEHRSMAARISARWKS